MKLIVGLGNPGRIYLNSRHNIGSSVVQDLARDCKISFKRDLRSCSLIGKGKIEGEDVVLASPITFMNLSGKAVASLVSRYKINLANLLVVCDDLDLEFGRLRIRPSGSSGGHRGLNSIIESLSSNAFCRLRIGIGRPDEDSEAAEFVLSGFITVEKKQIKKIISRASACCQTWVTEGVAESMNIFNPVLSKAIKFNSARKSLG
jgi:PTH1 family peptidyl-tRNA hydrolase